MARHRNEYGELIGESKTNEPSPERIARMAAKFKAASLRRLRKRANNGIEPGPPGIRVCHYHGPKPRGRR